MFPKQKKENILRTPICVSLLTYHCISQPLSPVLYISVCHSYFIHVYIECELYPHFCNQLFLCYSAWMESAACFSHLRRQCKADKSAMAEIWIFEKRYQHYSLPCFHEEFRCKSLHDHAYMYIYSTLISSMMCVTDDILIVIASLAPCLAPL